MFEKYETKTVDLTQQTVYTQARKKPTLTSRYNARFMRSIIKWANKILSQHCNVEMFPIQIPGDSNTGRVTTG